MKNLLAKLLFALAVFGAVNTGAGIVSAATLTPTPVTRITENEQELSELRWEMNREENERGHESFEPGKILLP